MACGFYDQAHLNREFRAMRRNHAGQMVASRRVEGAVALSGSANSSKTASVVRAERARLYSRMTGPTARGTVRPQLSPGWIRRTDGCEAGGRTAATPSSTREPGCPTTAYGGKGVHPPRAKVSHRDDGRHGRRGAGVPSSSVQSWFIGGLLVTVVTHGQVRGAGVYVRYLGSHDLRRPPPRKASETGWSERTR